MRVFTAERQALCGVGPSRHGSPSVVEAGHALAARRRSRPSTRWGFFRVCRMLLHVRRSHLRRSGSPWLRRRLGHGRVVSGNILVAARRQDALLPRVGSAAFGCPNHASSAAGHGGHVAHVPQVRWPRVFRPFPARVSRSRGGVLSSQPHNYSLQRISTRNSKVWYRVRSARAR